MTTEDTIIRISRLAGQLYADLKDVMGNEQQALQVIADYFEKVGEIAIDAADRPFASELVDDLDGALIGSGGLNSCRCMEYETCPVCIQRHAHFEDTPMP